MKRTALVFLLFLCYSDHALGRNGGHIRGATVEENVAHALAQLDLAHTVRVTGVTKSNVFAVPVPAEDGSDRLALDFYNKKRWRKVWPVFTKLEHHGDGGWRTKRSYSLHVISHHLSDGSRYYEMHVDRWSPSFWHPRGEWCHFFLEYLPHKLTRHFTNQEKIARGLEKEDRILGRRTRTSF